MRYVLLCCFLLNTAWLTAQVRYPYPAAGASGLLPYYFGINFTPAQRNLLAGRRVNLRYVVSIGGELELEDVFGVAAGPVRDSLRAATGRVPLLVVHPDTARRRRSTYTLSLRFPDHWRSTTESAGQVEETAGSAHRRYALSDFSRLESRDELVYFAGGPVTNAFLRETGRFYTPGGGFRLAAGVTTESGWGSSVQMELYLNSTKQRIPLRGALEQYFVTRLFFLGVSADYAFEADAVDWRARLLFNIAMHQIARTPIEGNTSIHQLHPWMIGLGIERSFLLGEPKIHGRSSPASITQGEISVGLTLYTYPVWRASETSGGMASLSVTYCWSQRSIKSYAFAR